jgi:hypothetical protein
MTIKCRLNCHSLYAYINNKQIYVDDLIKSTNEKLKKSIKCIHGHSLTFINSTKYKPHFRHKNIKDTINEEMTEWHYEWQMNFPTTEIYFNIINNKQIKVRRADVVLTNSNYNIEFQHSYIEKIEIQNRKNDYELHNRKIIWIIHGNKTINVKYLEYSNRYYLEFITDKWKYENFIDYEYIFIDIDEKIYKIFPKYVKNGMIDVEPPICKKQFIIYLNENNSIIHVINLPLQSNLYIKQQGAGNGKTFGLIQNIESKEFEHYSIFIIVSKQHSAKTVIYNEFKEQISNKQLKYIKNLTYDENNKKYQISYTNENTGNNCNILIATVDSLMYSLGNNKNTELNKFEGIINSIIDGYIEEQKINHIKCNGKNYKLNKELCLFIDETQDLSEDYAKAIIKIMRDKYIDSYIVGDKLQSISIINNAFNYLQDYDFSYINKIEFEKSNISRRYNHKDLIDLINYNIPFSKYGLPHVQAYKNSDDNNNHVIIFEGKDTYNNIDYINSEVEKIMKYYNKEVLANNYKPNDFLIITPFTNKNPLVNSLEIAIEMYWNNKYNNDTYNRYAIFHKSEHGNSINLTDSENATRIVSIHTSKGDGRNVVFVIGLDEKSLLKISNEKDNLIYDSLIHVALTRMKKTIYIRIINNGDDIAQKIGKYIYTNNLDTDIKPLIFMKNKIKYKEDIIDAHKNNIDFEILQKLINKTNYSIPIFNENEKNIIDESHHNIRYASMLIFLFIKILNNEIKVNDINIKKQLKVIFINIKDAKLNKVFEWQDYYNHIKEKKLCILKITNNGKDYIKYYNIICLFIYSIQKKLDKIINNNNNNNILCPLESIILYYLIEIYNKGIYADITLNELYNIIDIYYNSFNNKYNGHDNCICKNNFNNPTIEKNNNIEKMSNYLLNHYDIIYNLEKLYDNFLSENPKITWLMNHNIYFNGKNKDFIICRNFKLIGYDEDKIFIIYIKPQFNSLNYNDIVIDSIYDTFIIKNITSILDEDDKIYNKNLEDYKKFNNKNIYIIVFSLNNNKYYTFDWNNIINNQDLISNNILFEQLKNKLIHKYIIESKYIVNYFNYYKLKYNSLSPDKIIKNIINDYKNEEKFDAMPLFILKFFQNIQYDLSYNKNKKIEILSNYDNYDFFMSKLKEVIIESIEEYLGIDNDI